MKFAECELSIKELEQFRDENGFIDLSKAELVLSPESREKRGNTERFKNWVNFAGTKALVKEEISIEDTKNFGIYSEIIMEEVARQVGLEYARTDLIKYQGKYGILSQMVLDPETESLETIYGLIGETTTDEDNPDICDYEEVEKKIIESLKQTQMSSEEIRKNINDRRKQKILQSFCCEADGHIENEGIIRYISEDGRNVTRIAPMFDNETSFLLDLNEGTLKDLLLNNDEYNYYIKYLEDFSKRIIKNENLDDLLNDDVFKIVVENLKRFQENEKTVGEILDGDRELRKCTVQRGKTVFIPKGEDLQKYPYDCEADNTLAYIRDIDDPEIQKFLVEFSQKIDIEAAIKSVEERINAKIPQIIKDVAITFVQMRKRMLDDILHRRKPCELKQEDARIITSRLLGSKIKNDYSHQIIRKSVEENISLGQGYDALFAALGINYSKEEVENIKNEEEEILILDDEEDDEILLLDDD